MKTIFLVGSGGKIGNIIKKILLDNKVIKSKFKIYLLDRPPYNKEEINRIS